MRAGHRPRAARGRFAPDIHVDLAAGGPDRRRQGVAVRHGCVPALGRRGSRRPPPAELHARRGDGAASRGVDAEHADARLVPCVIRAAQVVVASGVIRSGGCGAADFRRALAALRAPARSGHTGDLGHHKECDVLRGRESYNQASSLARRSQGRTEATQTLMAMTSTIVRTSMLLHAQQRHVRGREMRGALMTHIPSIADKRGQQGNHRDAKRCVDHKAHGRAVVELGLCSQNGLLS
jgi:hypothetical protein